MHSLDHSQRREDCAAHFPALYRYARRLTKGGGGADDLVQDTLARYLAARASGRLCARPKNREAYLLSILHNLFVDGMRRRQSEAVVPLDDLDPVAPARSEPMIFAALLKAFRDLPRPQAEALYRRAVLGESYAEIAAAQGVAIGTAMSRLNRARKALRSLRDLPPS